MRWTMLGKQYGSKLGRYCEKNGISQKTLCEKTKLTSGTMSRLFNDSDATPTFKNGRKILNAINDLCDDDLTFDDLW